MPPGTGEAGPLGATAAPGGAPFAGCDDDLQPARRSVLKSASDANADAAEKSKLRRGFMSSTPEENVSPMGDERKQDSPVVGTTKLCHCPATNGMDSFDKPPPCPRLNPALPLQMGVREGARRWAGMLTASVARSSAETEAEMPDHASTSRLSAGAAPGYP